MELSRRLVLLECKMWGRDQQIWIHRARAMGNFGARLRSLNFIQWTRIPLVLKHDQKRSALTNNKEDALKEVTWVGELAMGFHSTDNRWCCYSNCSGPSLASRGRRWPLFSLKKENSVSVFLSNQIMNQGNIWSLALFNVWEISCTSREKSSAGWYKLGELFVKRLGLYIQAGCCHRSY